MGFNSKKIKSLVFIHSFKFFKNMPLKESFRNDSYKVLEVTFKKGEGMPLHKASSDAFVINRKGTGKITFEDREVLLSQGDTVLIKANEPHKMDILEDFNASIILEPNASIDFVKN